MRRLPDPVIDWCVEELCRHSAPSSGSQAGDSGGCAALAEVAFGRRDLEGNRAFRNRLRSGAYDVVLDTQGLLKAPSSPVSPGSGLRLRRRAAPNRWPPAFTTKPSPFPSRPMRSIATAGLPQRPLTIPGPYPGLRAAAIPVLPPTGFPGPYAVLLSATSRDDKLWDEASLSSPTNSPFGMRTVFPAGNPVERRAARLVGGTGRHRPRRPWILPIWRACFASARLCVGVDTGLTHLAAAVAVPTVALYSATAPERTGWSAPHSFAIWAAPTCPRPPRK